MPGGFAGPRFVGQIYPSFYDFDDWSVKRALALFKVLKNVEPYGDFNRVLRSSDKWDTYMKNGYRRLQQKSLLWNRVMFSPSVAARKYRQWSQHLPPAIRKHISL